MSSPEMRAHVLVLKKTKLGESDLILHMLGTDGSALRAVAKGARKPRNASSATLDLFNEAELTLVSGKNLSIAKGSRLVEHHQALYADPARFAAASVVAEAVDACIQPDLPVDRLFAMTSTAFASLASAPESALPYIVAAYALKLTALLGMRPSLRACALCGEPMAPSRRTTRFSYTDGGAVCDGCALEADTTNVSAQALMLADALLRSTFADVAQMPERGDVWDVVDVAWMWFVSQTGARMRSLASFKAICGCLQESAVI